jgi:hypothetical protein
VVFSGHAYNRGVSFSRVESALPYAIIALAFVIAFSQSVNGSQFLFPILSQVMVGLFFVQAHCRCLEGRPLKHEDSASAPR